MQIKLAHSPDSDDAFMFYALAKEKIDTGDLHFTHVLEPIEVLNQKALDCVYDVTALSFHAYAYLADKYLLLSSGASMGERYGPIVVARRPDYDFRGKIAVPGTLTTAFLMLKLFCPKFDYEVVRFDQIIGEVARGNFDAGLIIHEGQLTYATAGLYKVVDLGQWWYERTLMPLPLGGNAVRSSLPSKVVAQIDRLLRQSIRYALEHKAEALDYALQFARDMDRQLANSFVSMYVNQRTLDYGEQGKLAVRLLLEEGRKAGIIPHKVDVRFIDEM
ncbi:MAG: ABC transporter substrate-binding protein [Blastocatellia bacterium]|nr:ABC transporter substrate-binding protein [Blastocatellia bacterium]